MSVLQDVLTHQARTLYASVRSRVFVHDHDTHDPSTPYLWINAAGLVCAVTRRYAVHLLLRPSHWAFGREEMGIDATAWGLGPLLKVVRDNAVPPVDPSVCAHDRGITRTHDGALYCAGCWRSESGTVVT